MLAARSRGNGTNFDGLRKACDISTCDLSPYGNPEKYGRPIKSAIVAIIRCGTCVPSPCFIQYAVPGILSGITIISLAMVGLRCVIFACPGHTHFFSKPNNKTPINIL